jgi:hypothetical protein
LAVVFVWLYFCHLTFQHAIQNQSKECPNNHNRSRSLLQLKIALDDLQHFWRRSQKGPCNPSETQIAQRLVLQPRNSQPILLQRQHHLQVPFLQRSVRIAQRNQTPPKNARRVLESSLRDPLHELPGHRPAPARQPITRRAILAQLHVKPHYRDVQMQRPRPQNLLTGRQGLLDAALPKDLFQQSPVCAL